MAECPWPVHGVVSNQDFLNVYDDLDLPRRNGLNRTRTITWEQTAEILLELNTPISVLPEPTDPVRLIHITPGPSKLENVADPCSGPRGPLPKIGVLYLNLIFEGSPLVSNLNHAYCEGHHHFK